MKLVYFASVRERVGRGDEEIALPPDLLSVSDLIGWLVARGDGYAEAFAAPGLVRAAIDRRHAKPDAPIAGAREIAFFPPMTGG